jgi:hypothetical protein
MIEAGADARPEGAGGSAYGAAIGSHGACNLAVDCRVDRSWPPHDFASVSMVGHKQKSSAKRRELWLNLGDAA